MDQKQREAYLDAMDIPRWQVRRPDLIHQAGPIEPVTDLASVPEPSDVETPEMPQMPVVVEHSETVPDESMSDWDSLAHAVAQCTACALHESRTQTVFGVGAKQADCLVIGEAPGADEDRQGEPFVGKAGQLLTAMLKAIGLTRNQVFIANILKCRPPNNRDPLGEEVQACEHFLAQQIAFIQPKVILSVGRVSAQNLLKTDVAVGKLRGLQQLPGQNIPVVVTYHPAYLLRKPSQKRAAWQDLKLLRSFLVAS